jgi:hypothetical protein
MSSECLDPLLGRMLGTAQIALNVLPGLQNLKFLGLGHTQVTNDGIKELAVLGRLESLNIVGTGVTNDGTVAYACALTIYC